MQGGFNGVNIFDRDEFNLTNNAVSSDMVFGNGRLLNDGPNVKAYTKAVDIMKNTTNVDIQLLAIPGLRHPIVTDYATVATEERFDALYIMDVEQYNEDGTDAENEIRLDSQITSVSNTIQSFRDRAIDSSFAAAYFPDVNYAAPDKSNVFVPPSVLVLGAMALNDAVGHPWFAPAGFTRGALPTAALEARVKLKDEDLDALYNERINPLIAFVGAPKSGTNPASGLVIWGQKTLQIAASSLDRVNVRRLLIEIRRQVREIANTVLFEQNREATLAAFSAAVTPRLQRIQALAGLERFRVIIDSSTTTQTDIENNTVRGKIFVQPTKSIEFVSLDFVVANNVNQ
jgi:phage tail sheath protein FI